MENGGARADDRGGWSVISSKRNIPDKDKDDSRLRGRGGDNHAKNSAAGPRAAGNRQPGPSPRNHGSAGPSHKQDKRGNEDERMTKDWRSSGQGNGTGPGDKRGSKERGRPQSAGPGGSKPPDQRVPPAGSAQISKQGPEGGAAAARGQERGMNEPDVGGIVPLAPQPGLIGAWAKAAAGQSVPAAIKHPPSQDGARKPEQSQEGWTTVASHKHLSKESSKKEKKAKEPAGKAAAKTEKNTANQQQQGSNKPKKSQIFLSDLFPVQTKKSNVVDMPVPYTQKQSTSSHSHRGRDQVPKGAVANPNPADSQRFLVLHRKYKAKKKTKLSKLKKTIISYREVKLAAEAKKNDEEPADEQNQEVPQDVVGSEADAEVLRTEISETVGNWFLENGLDPANPSHVEELLSTLNEEGDSDSENGEEVQVLGEEPASCASDHPDEVLVVEELNWQSTTLSIPTEEHELDSSTDATRPTYRDQPVSPVSPGTWASWAHVSAPEFKPGGSTDLRRQVSAPEFTPTVMGGSQVTEVSESTNPQSPDASSSKGKKKKKNQGQSDPAVPTGAVLHGENKKSGLSIRDYCDQELDEELNKKVEAFLRKLVEYQDRLRERDPAKARIKKRLSSGLREVYRSIRTNEAVVVIVAPNIEQCPTEGGLDEKVLEIIKGAKSARIPLVFALSRNRLGRALGKSMRMSAAVVHSVDGVYEQFQDIVKTTDALIQLHAENRAKTRL